MRALLPAALLAALLLPADPAAALFGLGGGGRVSCDRTDDDAAEASRTIRRVNARLDAMEGTIVRALGMQTGQQSGYTAKSAEAVVTALDAHARLRAQTAREEAEAAAQLKRRPTGPGCAAVTGLAGLGPARAAGEAAARRSADAETGRILADPTVAGKAAGAAADSAARLAAIAAAYCAPGRAGPGGAACAGAEADHGADLLPGRTLFDRGTFADAAQAAAAVELSRNLAAPVVHDRLPLSAASTPEARRRLLAARAADARQALASDLYAHLRGLRAPGPALGRWAEAVAPGARPDPDAPLSRRDLLAVLAAQRFEDPAWFVQLQSMDEAALLREAVALAAIGLVLDWERFRLEERAAGIAAAALAGDTEARRAADPALANPSGTVR